MNMGNFSWKEQGKKLQLCYHLEDREIVDARGVGLTSEQEIDGLVPYLFTSAAGERMFVYQIGKRTAISGTMASVMRGTELLTLCQNMIESLIRLQQRGTDTQKLVYHVSCIFVNKKTMQPDWIYLPLREYDAPDTALGELLTELIYQARLGSSEDGIYTREILGYIQQNPMVDLANLKQLTERLLQQSVFDAQIKAQEGQKGKRKRAKKKGKAPGAITYPAANMGMAGGNAQSPMYAGFQGFSSGNSYGVGRMPSASGAQGTMPPPTGFMAATQAPSQRQAYMEPRGFEVSDKGSTGTGFDLLYKQQAQQRTKEEEQQTSSETVVLGEEEEQGTTVLSTNTVQEKTPRLVRVKTGESISIDQPSFCLGKGKAGTDYLIADNGAISRNHVKLICQNGEYFAEDQNSTNHTYLNGVMLSPQKPEKLTDGDVLKLADEDFRFEFTV